MARPLKKQEADPGSSCAQTSPTERREVTLHPMPTQALGTPHRAFLGAVTHGRCAFTTYGGGSSFARMQATWWGCSPLPAGVSHVLASVQAEETVEEVPCVGVMDGREEAGGLDTW